MKETIQPTKKGQKPLTFNKGGLHRALGVPEGQTIPADKMAAALAGKYGPKVKQMAEFAKNVLEKGRKTAAEQPGSYHEIAAKHAAAASRKS